MEENRKRSGSEPKVPSDKNVIESNTVELDTIEEKPKIENKNINITPKENKEIKNKKKKRKLNKQSIAVIIIIIGCIVITICLIILKIRKINAKYSDTEVSKVFEIESKKEDPDLKYVVGENDTLDYNDLSYETMYIIDGVETTDPKVYYNSNNTQNEYSYIKISGLKDKDVENNINNDIKKSVIEFGKKNDQSNYRDYSYVLGNFNNILSIVLSTYDKDNNYIHTGLNYDLNTGEKIVFEDVFTKSAPIISILSSAVTKNLAWDVEMDIKYDGTNDEEYFSRRAELYNMDNRDTSEYEDVIFEVEKWYKENKGNIQFAIDPTKLYVYNVNIKDKNYTLTVPLYENSYCIAIYKRYNGTNLYDNDICGEGYKPFTMPMAHYSNCKKENQIDYGMKANNLFVDVSISNYSNLDNEEIKNKIYSTMKVFTQNALQEETKKANENKSMGYIFQANLSVSDNTNYTNYYSEYVGGYPIPYYIGKLSIYEVELSIKDFSNLDYYLYKAALVPSASAETFTVRNCLINQNKISGDIVNIENYFFDTDGNYLGDDWSVIKDTSREGYNPS